MAGNRFARPVKYLPYALQHKRAGTLGQGRARAAQGLMVRGVVMKTYIPDDPADAAQYERRPWIPGSEKGILCDVLVLDPEFKSYLRDVPIMMQSAGLNDHEIWRPRASTVDLTGAPLNWSLEGVPAPTTGAQNMDGDHVVIAFMGNDTNQPVIIGQLPHPNTHRRPSFVDPVKPQYKWRRFVRGIDMGVTVDGNVDIDLSNASDGAIVPAGGVEIPLPGPEPLSGNVTITMFTGTLPAATKFRIVDSAVSSPEPVILGDTWLTDMNGHLTDLNSWLTSLSAALSEMLAIGGLGFPVVNIGSAIAQTATLQAAIAVYQGQITAAQAVGLPYLSSHVEVD